MRIMVYISLSFYELLLSRIILFFVNKKSKLLCLFLLFSKLSQYICWWLLMLSFFCGNLITFYEFCFLLYAKKCGRHCLFVLIKSKREHMHSIFFKDDVCSDCCCYCLVIIRLLIDILFDCIASKRNYKVVSRQQQFVC